MGWLDAPAKEQPTNPYPYLDLSGVSGKTLEEKIQRLQMHNTDVLNAVNQAGADYYARTKKPLPLTSGARTWDEQNDLYQRSLKGEKGIYMPTNPEGKPKDYVFHREAFDIPSGVADEELKAYGLHRPLGAKDPVHVTLRTPMAKEDTSWLSSPVEDKKEAPVDEWKPVAETLLEQGKVPGTVKDDNGAPKPTTRSHSGEGALYGTGIGLAKGVAEKVVGAPEAPKGPNAIAAQEKLNAARDRLALAQENLQNAHGSGASVADLEAEFQASKSNLRYYENELEEAKKALSPPKSVSGAVETAEEIASRTKPGASGASNWVRAMGEEIPDVIANQAENMRKDNPKGGQALIDEYNAARAKTPGFEVAKTPGGVELALPSDNAAKMNAELAEKQAQSAEQARQAQLAAQKQAEFDRQVAEMRLKQAREAKRTAGEAVGQSKTDMVTRQKELARLEAEAQKAGNAHTLAQSAAQRATDVEPSMVGKLGYKIAQSPILANTLGGLGTGLSVAEAIDRYQKGDTTGVVLATLEAAFGGMSMLPPVTPVTAALKGVGVVGGLGMIPVQMARDKFFPYQPPKKAQ